MSSSAGSTSTRFCSKCDICTEDVTSLRCHHNFCTNCYTQLERQVRPGVEMTFCPPCKDYVITCGDNLDIHQLAELFDDVYHNQIENKLTSEAITVKEQICGQCERAVAEMFCINCKLPLCDTCKVTHLKLPTFGKHCLIVMATCNQCEKDKPEYYCFDCKIVLCTICHGTHLKLLSFEAHKLLPCGWNTIPTDTTLNCKNIDKETLSPKIKTVSEIETVISPSKVDTFSASKTTSGVAKGISEKKFDLEQNEPEEGSIIDHDFVLKCLGKEMSVDYQTHGRTSERMQNLTLYRVDKIMEFTTEHKHNWYPRFCHSKDLIWFPCYTDHSSMIGGYNSDGKLVKSIKLNDINTPEALHPLDADQMLVASSSGLYLFDVNRETVIAMVMEDRVYDVHGTSSIIAALTQSKVHILDAQPPFKHISQFEHNCSNALTILLTDSTVYVSSDIEQTISKFNIKGELQGQYGKKGRSEVDELCSPFLCALDRTGSVLVADWGNHRLKIMDAEGKWRVVLGIQGVVHSDAMIVDGYLYVCRGIPRQEVYIQKYKICI